MLPMYFIAYLPCNYSCHLPLDVVEFLHIAAAFILRALLVLIRRTQFHGLSSNGEPLEILDQDRSSIGRFMVIYNGRRAPVKAISFKFQPFSMK